MSGSFLAACAQRVIDLQPPDRGSTPVQSTCARDGIDVNGVDAMVEALWPWSYNPCGESEAPGQELDWQCSGEATSLWHACRLGQLSLVVNLVAKGADVNFACSSDLLSDIPRPWDTNSRARSIRGTSCLDVAIGSWWLHQEGMPSPRCEEHLMDGEGQAARLKIVEVLVNSGRLQQGWDDAVGAEAVKAAILAEDLRPLMKLESMSKFDFVQEHLMEDFLSS